MNETQFHHLADQVMAQIEQIVENFNQHTAPQHSIDYENDGSVLTLLLNDQRKIILNRQSALQQLWLATRCSGYHFSYQAQQWICVRSGRSLGAVLSEACAQQAGVILAFDDLVF